MKILTKELQLENENMALRNIVKDFAWMARRYCENRQSYATSLFNDNVRQLLNLNVELNPTADGTIWCHDLGGRSFDHLNEEEALQGSDCVRMEVADLLKFLQTVSGDLSVVIEVNGKEHKFEPKINFEVRDNKLVIVPI